MTKPRSKLAMTEDEVFGFLETQRTVNVATIGPTGHPHLVAMWFVMIDGKLTFWSYGKSQKVLNLRRDPRFTCLVESGDRFDQLRGVELVGTAQIIEDFEGVMAVSKALRAKHSDGANPSADTEMVEKQVRKRVAIQMVPERVVSWDHSKAYGAH